jgi:2-polyprenyl-6-methoxyphenol hydroxylase-like FAD-dependent oxidoreductase
LALRRRGIEAIVYERSASLSEIGAGINLGPNALKAFRALGIAISRILASFCGPRAAALRRHMSLTTYSG